VSAIGLERVVSPAGVLPRAAERLDASAEIAPHEVRVRVRAARPGRRVLPAAVGAHGGDGDAVRAAVLEIVAARGVLIGNGYVPGHAELALDLVRTDPGVRMLFDARLDAD
jgi:hypothetical protein